MKKSIWLLIGCALLLGIVIGCRQTPKSQPTPTTIPQPTAGPPEGWVKFEGEGVEVWLPESYRGGDPNQDLDTILEEFELVGPEFDRMAKALERNAPFFVIWAFDSEVNNADFLTNMNITKERVAPGSQLDFYMDTMAEQFAFGTIESSEIVTLDRYQAGRMVITLDLMGAQSKEVLYTIHHNDVMWNIVFAASVEDFDRKLPIFEQSVRTFFILSEEG